MFEAAHLTTVPALLFCPVIQALITDRSSLSVSGAGWAARAARAG